jgi:hypothetical protein
MSADQVIAKFTRYAEPTLGTAKAAALTAFFLQADGRSPISGVMS